MRILEVISSLGPTGGAETFAVNFCRSICEKEQLTVVILYNSNKDFFLKLLHDKNIDTIILNKKKKFDLKVIRALRRIIVEKKIDVIHTENNALISSFFAVLPLKKRPHIFHTVHNPAKIEAGKIVSQALYKCFMKTTFVTPVAISKEMKKSCEEFYGLSNLPFIPNGIDLKKYTGKKPLINREIDISVIARFEYQKNHNFLLEVFKMVHDRIPSLNVVMAGAGSLEKTIRDKIKCMSADTYIKIVGLVDDSSKITENSKIIALGSLYEGNPLCLLEGMASGNVVVATSVGGIPDIVDNGVNGFLFDVGNCYEFAEQIIHILENTDYYETIRLTNCKKSAIFSMDYCAAKYIQLFRKRL